MLDEPSSDAAVEALRRLIGDSAQRRAEVADQLGCNEQTLYQIISGVRLKSGHPRSVGRKLRVALDQAFPGWLASAEPAAPAIPLRLALPVVLDALAACTARAELRQLLPLLIDSDAPAYRQRLTELLLGGMTNEQALALVSGAAVESSDIHPATTGKR